MKKSAHKHILNLGIVATLLPHLFCCVLPTVLAALSLVAPAGDMARWQIIPESWMPWLFVISGVMLAISYYLVFRPKCDCHCDECDVHHHRGEKIVLIVVTTLFVISLTIHLAAH